MVEDRPIRFGTEFHYFIFHLYVFGQNWPITKQSHGLFATAALLDIFCYRKRCVLVHFSAIMEILWWRSVTFTSSHR